MLIIIVECGISIPDFQAEGRRRGRLKQLLKVDLLPKLYTEAFEMQALEAMNLHVDNAFAV